MGKVTIIVESDDMSTTQLEEMLQNYNSISEAELQSETREQTGTMPTSMRVYIVPSDED